MSQRSAFGKFTAKCIKHFRFFEITAYDRNVVKFFVTLLGRNSSKDPLVTVQCVGLCFSFDRHSEQSPKVVKQEDSFSQGNVILRIV